MFIQQQVNLKTTQICRSERNPYVIIQGPEEAGKNVVKLKTMVTKEQEELTIEQVIDKLTKAD